MPLAKVGGIGSDDRENTMIALAYDCFPIIGSLVRPHGGIDRQRGGRSVQEQFRTDSDQTRLHSGEHGAEEA